MKAWSSIFILTILFSSCKENSEKMNIDWKIAGNLPAIHDAPHIGVAGPLVGILEGKLLVAGGANFPDKMPWDGGSKFYQADAYLYDITEDTLILNAIVSFPDTLAYSANVSVDNAIYALGGENKNGISDRVTRYTLYKNNVQSAALPNLPIALSNGAAVKVGQSLYYIGGENSDIVSDKVYKMSLDSPSNWSEVLTLPYALSHAVVTTDNSSKIYIIGGRKKNINSTSDIYDKVLEVNLSTNQVKELTKLPQALAAGTGVLIDNHLVVIGGDNASTFHQVEKLIGKINASKDDSLKNELTQQKNKLQLGHPGFSKEVIAFDLDKLKWKQLNPLVGESPVTTTAILHQGKIIIPSGEIKAGVRTSQILIGKF